MNNTRRLKRMTRSKNRMVPGLNLTSLMDVFTVLVFFLLINTSDTEELSNPKDLTLPESVSESRPEQTVVLMVTPEQVLIKGEAVISLNEVDALDDSVVPALRDALLAEFAGAQGLTAGSQERLREITIMGDRQIPFRILKKIMASCTSAGYEKISLAVTQKSA